MIMYFKALKRHPFGGLVLFCVCVVVDFDLWISPPKQPVTRLLLERAKTLYCEVSQKDAS